VHAVTTRGQVTRETIKKDTGSTVYKLPLANDGNDAELTASNGETEQCKTEQTVVNTSNLNSDVNNTLCKPVVNEIDRPEDWSGDVEGTDCVVQPYDTIEGEANLNVQSPRPIIENMIAVRDNTTINSRVDFAQRQQQDDSLKHLFKLAQAGSNQYFIEDGILYRRSIGGGELSDDKLLCVPSCYREQLVRTAHDSMWSAHSGARRTAQRERLVLLSQNAPFY